MHFSLRATQYPLLRPNKTRPCAQGAGSSPFLLPAKRAHPEPSPPPINRARPRLASIAPRAAPATAAPRLGLSGPGGSGQGAAIPPEVGWEKQAQQEGWWPWRGAVWLSWAPRPDRLANSRPTTSPFHPGPQPLDGATAATRRGHCPRLRRLTLAWLALRASPCGLRPQFLKRPRSALKVGAFTVQRAFSDATVQPLVQESHSN